MEVRLHLQIYFSYAKIYLKTSKVVGKVIEP